MKMVVLIPSYEPDVRLINLIEDLQASIPGMPIVVVDDGSGESYGELFKQVVQLGCMLLTHKTNLGKGRALKTGFNYIRSHMKTEGAVCADSDGQHLPTDIKKIAEALREYPGRIVTGSRRFTGKVPLRSRFGNTLTRKMYAFSTGVKLYDTQTGLRGYPAHMLDWLCELNGERFEYEMNMLLEAPGAGYALHEIPIDTVYLNENKSSHFHPIKDSVRVYMPIVKFIASSLSSFIIDFVLLFILQLISGHLLFAVVGARLGSSIVNFSLNRKFVFRKGSRASSSTSLTKSLPKYYALVVIVLLLNYAFLHLLNINLGVPLLVAKLLTEAVLFLFSYWSQRKFVY
ncbi:bifunctional glycosyltransferase family 2/GtrA family protein [Paenibacillus harenae]|uniref:bifunctional glycosyltransferase family 2/GtrA family protein n=1 Tax=Paenibacillus harenae TaxID=306543 RepID=UPI00278ED099|nr:bifunctional glycosyltransferase family 2/GtrA family protein [Paenibacillus harenae]MDQ0060910.1 glycosyltransferase involved in cell wall biosynthesis [Paenibacillus harenae]